MASHSEGVKALRAIIGHSGDVNAVAGVNKARSSTLRANHISDLEFNTVMVTGAEIDLPCL